MEKDYKTKILIDTDIGDDIDDAFAVALAAASDCDLVAVTTVFRNTRLRARQAMQLLSVAGSDTPVYVGEGMPLAGKIVPFGIDSPSSDLMKEPPCQYDDGMAKFAEGGDAVQKIIRLSKKYSGELVLVPIGGMTNIAKALTADPSIAKDIKAIVTMHGWYENFAPEWNVICDPEAANVVYGSGVPFYGVGLDVTLKCVLDDKLMADFRKSQKPVNKLIITWLDRWFERFKFEKSVMHDPLAVSYAIGADTLKFKKIYARAVTEGNMRGAVETSLTEKDGFYPINYAYDVDAEKFYALIREKML